MPRRSRGRVRLEECLFLGPADVSCLLSGEKGGQPRARVRGASGCRGTPQIRTSCLSDLVEAGASSPDPGSAGLASTPHGRHIGEAVLISRQTAVSCLLWASRLSPLEPETQRKVADPSDFTQQSRV